METTDPVKRLLIIGRISAQGFHCQCGMVHRSYWACIAHWEFRAAEQRRMEKARWN